MLVELFLFQIYFKLKGSNNVQDTSHHFRNLISYDGSMNLVNLDISTCWMVDKYAIILIHVDTRLRTTTLCVPKFADVDVVVMKETLEDVNKLIKYSINNNLYE